MNVPQLLFVSGDAKSGTSSVVGMLNAHPDIFVMYEADPNRAAGVSKRGLEFLQRYPEAAPFFHPHQEWTEPYDHLRALLAAKGKRYRYFGDKVLSYAMGDDQVRAMGSAQVVYLVRDLRTWLCKNVVVDYLLEEQGLAPRAVQYVDSFLRSFLLPKVLHVSMEEMIHQNGKLLRRLDAFLEIPLSAHAEKWWALVGKYSADDPKGAVAWWDGHDSSRLKPRSEDTQAELKAHAFWDQILPIFDRYYLRLEEQHDPASIARDRAALQTILPCNVRHADLYESVKSVSFGAGLFGRFGHRSSNRATKPFNLG